MYLPSKSAFGGPVIKSDNPIVSSSYSCLIFVTNNRNIAPRRNDICSVENATSLPVDLTTA